MGEVEVEEYLPRLAVRVDASRPVAEKEVIRGIGLWWRKAMRIACGGDSYPEGLAIPNLLFRVGKSNSVIVYGGPILKGDYNRLVADDNSECTSEVNRTLKTGWLRKNPIAIVCGDAVCTLNAWDIEYPTITPRVAARKGLGPVKLLY